MEFKGIIEKFKTSIVTVLFVALIISLGINFIYYKGMTFNIDKKIINNNRSDSYSTSMSGSMIVNGEFYGGNKFEKRKETFNTEDEAEECMQKLNIFSWLWSKEFYDFNSKKYIVKYPYFFNEQKNMKLNKQRQVK